MIMIFIHVVNGFFLWLTSKLHEVHQLICRRGAMPKLHSWVWLVWSKEAVKNFNEWIWVLSCRLDMVTNCHYDLVKVWPTRLICWYSWFMLFRNYMLTPRHIVNGGKESWKKVVVCNRYSICMVIYSWFLLLLKVKQDLAKSYWFNLLHHLSNDGGALWWVLGTLLVEVWGYRRN